MSIADQPCIVNLEAPRPRLPAVRVIDPPCPPEATPLERALYHLGYRHQCVAPLADIQLVAEEPCLRCGWVGLQLRPWWRGPSLRLVVRCPVCGHEEER